MASWRTGPSPVFHQQPTAHSRLPLFLSSPCCPEMLAESAQGVLPGPGSAGRPRLAAAMGAEKAPPRICPLSAAGTREETRRKTGLIPQEESQ